MNSSKTDPNTQSTQQEKLTPFQISLHSSNIEHTQLNTPVIKEEEEEKSQSEESFPLSIIICFFCEEPIVSSAEMLCGHAFCEYCISEYLLVSLNCPICDVKIREKKVSANKRLDEIIEEFCGFIGGKTIENLKIRKEERKKIKDEKKESVCLFRLEISSTGTEVDVRDSDYIWRKGRIVRTFNRLNEQSRVKFLVVEYLETEKREEFSPSSPRLAKAGYYTSRKDIPYCRQYFDHSGSPKKKVKLTEEESEILESDMKENSGRNINNKVPAEGNDEEKQEEQ